MLVLFSYIYYVQCLIFDAISKAVSRSMNFDNLQNTVYVTVELHIQMYCFLTISFDLKSFQRTVWQIHILQLCIH